MNSPRSGAFYTGLGLTTAATLALEIIQTRILSVVSWYHLAFFVISVALFGLTVGALLVFLRPQRFASPELGRSLGRYAFYAALAVPLAYLDQIVLAPEMVFSLAAVVAFARLALTVALPFFFSGVVVTLALTRSPYPLARAYGADLVGAAAGCLSVIPLLSVLDGGGALFAAGAAFAASSVLFARWDADARAARRGLVLAGALVLAAMANSATYLGLDPILVKGRPEGRRSVAYERWNSFSRVLALKARWAAPAVALWAPSPNTPETPVEIVAMNIDGLATTSIFAMRGDPSRVRYLTYDATAMAHAVRSGSILVIGVGGGKDVMSALASGNERVRGIELNPAMTQALRGPYRDFAGLADRPGVELVTDEARSYLARHPERYDLIQMSLVDTWAATGAGAFTLSENALYTVEAWRLILSRLTEGGVFTVSRWYASGHPDETARLLSLACAALFEQGVAQPAAHLMLGAHGNLATLLVSDRPFSQEDVARLRRHCAEMGFELLVAPGLPAPSGLLGRILAAGDRAQLERVAAEGALDLSPPTDDRPFFFNVVRLTRPWEARRHLEPASGVVAGNVMATLTLATVVLVSLALAALTLLLPRWLAPGAPSPGWRALLYFVLIGGGFMLAEIALLQRLSVFLGHPTYSLAVVLFSLILFTGLGSLASERLPLDTRGRFALFALSLSGYLAAAGPALAALTRGFAGAPLAGRVALAVALLAPAGLLMGQAFPAGMKRFGAASPDARPWLWAVNGAAGVAASTLAVAISIAAGTLATLGLGAACYAATLLVLPRRAR
jgi:hypothetical protein